MSDYTKNQVFVNLRDTGPADPFIFDAEFDEIAIAIISKEDSVNKDAVSGYAGLDANSEVIKLPSGAAAAGNQDVFMAGGTFRKNNMAATAAPTATDDSAAGYEVGSVWIDTTNDKSYVLVDATATAAIWQTISGGLISQSELKTTPGVVSTTADTALVTLPGGEYGFFPQGRVVGGDFAYIGQRGQTPTYTAQYSSTAYVTNVQLGANTNAGNTAYLQQRYIQASPPYNLGNGDIPIFIFAMVDKTTGDIIGAYVAEDPPWANNGPTNIKPDMHRNGKPFKRIPRMTWPKEEALADAVKLKANLLAMDSLAFDEVEVTQAMKQADMALVPHPFASIDTASYEAILLDPLSPIVSRAHRLSQIGDHETISEIIHGGHLNLGRTKKAGLITPPGVIGVSARLK